ncbi:hypothetical protein IJT17_01970 [bacterium]|nr:hypothetical protein [bacterium]
MKPYSLTRDIAVMGMAVACNAALELTLGTFLHAVHFPLTGSLMVVVNACVYALAYSYNPRFGRITLMGLASAVVSLILAGGLKFTIMPALVTEAAVIDIFISCLGLNRLGFIASGAMASLTSFGFKLFNMYVFRGIPLDAAVHKAADIGVSWDSIYMMLTAMVAYRLAIGALFAWALWGMLVRLLSMLTGQTVQVTASEHCAAGGSAADRGSSVNNQASADTASDKAAIAGAASAETTPK